MDLPMLDAMEAEWRRHPPVHWLVAGFMKYTPKTAPAAVTADDHVDDLLADLGNLPVQPGAAIDSSAFDAAMKARGNDHG